MKQTVADLLEQRMEKTTTEQFWAVATLTGLDAIVITQKRDLVMSLPVWVVLIAITVATIYGVYFIVDRHRSYYFYRRQQAELLKDELSVPEFMKKSPSAWKGRSLSGLVFYAGWIVLLGAASTVACLR